MNLFVELVCLWCLLGFVVLMVDWVWPVFLIQAVVWWLVVGYLFRALVVVGLLLCVMFPVLCVLLYCCGGLFNSVGHVR